MSEASQRRQTSVEIEGGHGQEREPDARGNRFIPPEDGYKWRKYGRKFIKNIGKNRSYFKCQRSDCFVRKKVDWSTSDLGSVRVVYEGIHNHDLLAAEIGSSQSRTLSSSANQYDLWTQVFGDRSASYHDNEFLFGDLLASCHDNDNGNPNSTYYAFQGFPLL